MWEKGAPGRLSHAGLAIMNICTARGDGQRIRAKGPQAGIYV